MVGKCCLPKKRFNIKTAFGCLSTISLHEQFIVLTYIIIKTYIHEEDETISANSDFFSCVFRF
jgi:hypothetical protein